MAVSLACITNIFAAGNFGSDSGTVIVFTDSNPFPLGPEITSDDTDTVAENATLAHSLTAGSSVTWAIIGGADAAQFEISGSTLRWVGNGTQDFEIPADADADNDYVVIVRATDTTTFLIAGQTITVTVTDLADALPDNSTSANEFLILFI
jgi:hypothetical protein